MIVKIPLNKNGLIAITELSKEKIPILGTGILHPHQALLAANLGVKYISPYFSHIKDFGDAYESLETMATILKESQTKILAASIRNLEDLIFCAEVGIEGVTIKDELYYELVALLPSLKHSLRNFYRNGKRLMGMFP